MEASALHGASKEGCVFFIVTLKEEDLFVIILDHPQEEQSKMGIAGNHEELQAPLQFIGFVVALVGMLFSFLVSLCIAPGHATNN